MKKSKIEDIAYKLHKIKYNHTNTFIKRVFSESMCFLALMVATYFVTFDSAAKASIGQDIFVTSVIIYIIYLILGVIAVTSNYECFGQFVVSWMNEISNYDEDDLRSYVYDKKEIFSKNYNFYFSWFCWVLVVCAFLLWIYEPYEIGFEFLFCAEILVLISTNIVYMYMIKAITKYMNGVEAKAFKKIK